jgi:signal transduction histidine kinase
VEDQQAYINSLLAKIDALDNKLADANNIIDAIREGSVDALVLQKNGQPHIYSIESADYTYRILIEKFGEGALSITDEGLILYCNDYFSKLIGIPATRITGTNLSVYVHTIKEYKQLLTALKKGPSKGELTLKIKTGKLPVYVSLTDLNPTVAAIGVVVTDLSEKKKNEQALLKHQQQLELKVEELHSTNTNLEQFIHVISHDLKEPLRKILMYTSKLNSINSDLFPENELHSINVIKSSAIRVNSLVDDLVKYSFIAIKDEISEVNLNEVLQDVLEDLELSITERKAVVTVAELPVIEGSKVQMRQLFSNLISNAIKYSKSDIHPEIKIESEIVESKDRNRQQFYKVIVQDNGIGMETVHLSKIFTIFQRLHLRNEYSGNGIGLAICKKIMENHRGSIAVESTPGDGSTFILSFPVNDAESNDA